MQVRKPTSQDPRQAGVGLAVAFSHGIYGRLLIFSVKKGLRKSQLLHGNDESVCRFSSRQILCYEGSYLIMSEGV